MQAVEIYVRKAAELAEKAENAVDAEARKVYRNLAESYRLLAVRLSPATLASDSEIEALARRMVEK